MTLAANASPRRARRGRVAKPSAEGARRSRPGSRRAGGSPELPGAEPVPAIDIVVDSPLWKAQPGIKAVLRRSIDTAAAMTATSGGEIAIVLTDDSAIRVLNRDWRGKDRPTNVLSFPAPACADAHPRKRQCAGADAASGQVDEEQARLLGDVVIAYETVAREASAAQKPFRNHLAHLAVHGFLHLLGHDHVAAAEADAMEAIEIAVLARLKMPNPYLAPSSLPAPKRRGYREREPAC